jgi:hypothetical protein
MKEYDPSIIEYMQDQYPDIVDSWEQSVLQDGIGSDYLQGIVEAYEHILEKFPYEPLDKNPKT